jgi:GAF domain-containing protein
VTREQRLASTFVELADSLVADFDVVELMTLLTERSIELLDASAAGLLLVDPLGALQVVAATSEATETVELFQIQNAEGPCHDCCRTGAPVDVPVLESRRDRWRLFVPVALEAGFRAAHAVPLRLRGDVLGALNLFRSEAVPLTAADLSTAQALADVATITLVQSRAAEGARIVRNQLEQALSSRVTIEQAKGVLAERLRCSVDEAFVRLRRHARTNGLRLSEVAREVSEGRLTV